MEKQLWEHIRTVRAQSPLVHNITNYVVMNNTANALLAIGASPIMAHAPEEMEEMVGLCHSLVINVGTLSAHWIGAMTVAVAKAQSQQKPWILDPVGAGATTYRNEVLARLLTYRPTVIRGNASEILALANHHTSRTKGVDSTAASNKAVDAAQWLSNTYGAIVCVSGEQDIILSGNAHMVINNGDALMTRITGLGCSATAVIGAFIGVVENKQEAVAAAMAMFSLCGELAAAESAGPGSLQVNLLDALYNLNESTFLQRVNIRAQS